MYVNARLVVTYKVALVIPPRLDTRPGSPPAQENKSEVHRAIEFPGNVSGHPLGHPKVFIERLTESLERDVNAMLKLAPEVS